jgi:hypothetical protein
VRDEVAHDGVVGVEQAGQELHVEPVRRHQIEPRIDGMLAGLAGESGQGLALQVLVLGPAGAQHLDEIPAAAEDGEAARIEVGLEGAAERGIAVDGEPAGLGRPTRAATPACPRRDTGCAW